MAAPFIKTIMEFKHTKIVKHPLKEGKYMVVNITFPFIPPYIGTKRECEKAQISAEKNSIKMLNEEGRDFKDKI